MNLTRILNRGAIYWADHSGNIGSEQSGMRPVIIIQNNIGNKFSPTVIVVSITSQIHKAKLPTHFEIPKNKYNGVTSDSVVLGEQLRTMDKRRIGDFIGYLDDEDMKNLDKILEVSLSLNNDRIIKIDDCIKEKIKNIVKHLNYLDGYITANLDMNTNLEAVSDNCTKRNSLICELKYICNKNSLEILDYYDEAIINNKDSKNGYHLEKCLVV